MQGPVSILQQLRVKEALCGATLLRSHTLKALTEMNVEASLRCTDLVSTKHLTKALGVSPAQSCRVECGIAADIEVFVPMSVVLGHQCWTAAPFIPSHSVVAIRRNPLFRESKQWSPAVHPWRATLEQPFPSKKRSIIHVRGLLCWDFKFSCSLKTFEES